MNHRNLQRNAPLREQLAAQYVLGTLKGGARRRFETWLHMDATLAQAVTQWQGRLNPLAEFAPAIVPPAHVWRSLETSLKLAGRRSAKTSSWWRRLGGSMAFWRGLGLSASAVATLLVVVLATREPQIASSTMPAPAITYVAALSGDDAQTAMVVTGDASRHTLMVRIVVAQNIAADKSLQLWAVPKQGAPRSLGLVAANGAVTLPLPDTVTPQAMPLLAISLEPKGGSPNPHAPTGPIILKGAWLSI